jgi:hypothetical protein
VIKHKENSIKKIRVNEAKASLAETDYRIIKVMEDLAAEKLEEMYPGEREKREAMRETIRAMMNDSPSIDPETSGVAGK